jgi:hypothetical protein
MHKTNTIMDRIVTNFKDFFKLKVRDIKDKELII